MKIVISTLLLFLFNIGFSQNIEWVTKTEDDYSVEHPKSWTYTTTNEHGAQFILKSPFSEDKDEFQENFSVMASDISDDTMSLERYVKVNTGALESQIEKYKVKDEKYEEDDFGKYFQLIFKGEIYGIKAYFIQRYYMIDDYVYVMTATTEKKTFKEFKPVIMKMMDSYESFLD